MIMFLFYVYTFRSQLDESYILVLVEGDVGHQLPAVAAQLSSGIYLGPISNSYSLAIIEDNCLQVVPFAFIDWY